MNMPSDKIRQLREKLLAHGDSGKVLVTEKGIGSGKDMQRKEETAELEEYQNEKIHQQEQLIMETMMELDSAGLGMGLGQLVKEGKF